jgi:hypothetical protein
MLRNGVGDALFALGALVDAVTSRASPVELFPVLGVLEQALAIVEDEDVAIVREAVDLAVHLHLIVVGAIFCSSSHPRIARRAERKWP